MAELYKWDRSFRLWTGAPKSQYKAAIVASRAPEVARAVEAVARIVYLNAKGNLAAHQGGSDDWGTGVQNLRVELRKGDFVDWHVTLTANGRPGDTEDDVMAALYSIENGRRAYTNKFGRRIPATQGIKVLAAASGGF